MCVELREVRCQRRCDCSLLTSWMASRRPSDDIDAVVAALRAE